MGAHLIDGEFQSDKYKTTPRGKVPLSVKDPAAQPLLWEYAERRRIGSHGSKEADAEFADDLQEALRLSGYRPPSDEESAEAALARVHAAIARGNHGVTGNADCIIDAIVS